MAIECKRVVAILLAAGRSERFGGDKLAASFDGEPLAHHAARALSAIGFARRIAVLGPSSVDLAAFGFDTVHAPAGSPMSVSIASGVREAEMGDCDACLIALADMPLIPESHFRALMQAHEREMTATCFENRNMVPALFARSVFPDLLRLTGDRGASSLLANAKPVVARGDWLADVDVPGDLKALDRRN